jgi:hypothetical protein
MSTKTCWILRHIHKELPLLILLVAAMEVSAAPAPRSRSQHPARPQIEVGCYSLLWSGDKYDVMLGPRGSWKSTNVSSGVIWVGHWSVKGDALVVSEYRPNDGPNPNVLEWTVPLKDLAGSTSVGSHVKFTKR